MPVPGTRFANKPTGEQTWAYKYLPCPVCCSREPTAQLCRAESSPRWTLAWAGAQSTDLQTHTAAPDQARPQDPVCTAMDNNYCLICIYTHIHINNYFVSLIEHNHITNTECQWPPVTLKSVSSRQHPLPRPVLSQNKRIHSPLPCPEHWYIHFPTSLQTQCVLHYLQH